MTEEEEEEAFDKAVGQLRLAHNEVLSPLRMYGQDFYVNIITDELISLAVQFHLKLSGVDMPYQVNRERLHY